jgi:membrane-associated protease RseP (regulator of RpoE activity)
MDEITAHKEPSAVLTEIPRQSPYTAPAPPRAEAPAIPPLNLGLFLLTFLTTSMAGAYAQGQTFSLWHPLQSAAALTAGFSFSIPLMLILLTHEMGHYLTARRNGVDTSLPYFIPAPFPSLFIVGTFGAFIRIHQMPRTRRVMFDIGAAGPWAGFILSVPIVIIGLALSHVGPLDPTVGGYSLGNSLLFLGLAHLVLHVNPNNVTIDLHPIAFAGWLGMFVTTLNLLPVGQLDGGHVVYALFGRRHRIISRLFVVGCILMVVVPAIAGWEFWGGWLFWAALLFMLGLGHPATVDEKMPLDPWRRGAAWATIAVFILTFCPVPVSYTPPKPAQEKFYNVSHTIPRPQTSIPHPRGL